ncbi:ATP-binding protein [Alicyclobacillus fodiniaquatilis]|uniref:histidine kinase n=1 Tax=Alicyclobacillus fodiniaquatilis TaxID=1661150 RepID=A0ABW4JN11_9BACL
MQRNGDDDEDYTISRLAAIGEISAGIAHEIRNPLTSVKGFLQLMQKEAPHRYLEVASAELEQAIATLHNLLQVSKPDLDDERYQPINLCSELESILYLFKDQTYRVQIRKEFYDTDCNIYGKRNQLKKVFFNLLKNAFEAIVDTGSITVTHRLYGNRLQVSIRDTGAGVPKQYISLLGTPFFSTKDNGVGMGLTQVFSTVYEHGGSIDVESQEGAGTTFTLDFRVNQTEVIGGIDLKLAYEEGQTFQAYMVQNRDAFYKHFETEASSSFGYMQDIDLKSLDILTMMDRLINILIEGNRHEMAVLGKELGRQIAKEDYPIVLISELMQTFRKCLWDFLYQYHRNVPITEEEVFVLERKFNHELDHYMTHYVSSYTEYKDEILKSHREVIDDLSVPVIPLSNTQAILPLVGTIDTYRAKRIQENTLTQISELKIEQIVIDVSAVAFLDTAVVGHLFRIVEGINLLGCEATITGIRPEIANTMITLGITLSGKVKTKGTLQQALEGMAAGE